MSTTTVEKLNLPSDQDSSGRELGDDEMALLAAAIESGTLTSTKGSMVKELERKFAAWLGARHAHACSHGTAALHTAIAAVDPEPGDEVITTPITDMGAITPILYQSAVPVFADVDPLTYNVTADTIERVVSERTRAIMVTHLFGNPCQMGPIMELAKSKGIPVIEDCAQCFGAETGGRMTGTIGDIGCFSLQQGKHITAGEGGLCVTDNEEFARRMFLFINKAWGYGDAKPDHYFLAPNYRMNEPTGAVALGQFDKLDGFIQRRIEIADAWNEAFTDLPGVQTPKIEPGDKHTYWKYCLRVDSDALHGGLDELAKRLKERGVFCAPRYIQKPAFECQVIRDQRTFGDSRFPFSLARAQAVTYNRADYAGTYDALAHVLVLPLNERYQPADIQGVATAVGEVVKELASHA